MRSNIASGRPKTLGLKLKQLLHDFRCRRVSHRYYASRSGQSSAPYSFSFRYKVVLPMPSNLAAVSLSPLRWAMAPRMVRFPPRRWEESWRPL